MASCRTYRRIRRSTPVRVARTDPQLMSLRSTQGNENALSPATTPYGSVVLPMSSRPKRSERRDLRFRGPVLDMFFERADWLARVEETEKNRTLKDESETPGKRDRFPE